MFFFLSCLKPRRAGLAVSSTSGRARLASKIVSKRPGRTLFRMLRVARYRNGGGREYQERQEVAIDGLMEKVRGNERVHGRGCAELPRTRIREKKGDRVECRVKTEREIKRAFEGCRGGTKASSGNPGWLKGAMRDYERIYSRFSAVATVRDDVAAATRIGVQITEKKREEVRGAGRGITLHQTQLGYRSG